MPRKCKRPKDFRKSRRFYVTDESPLIAAVERGQAERHQYDRRHVGLDRKLQSIGLGGCGFYSSYKDAMNFLKEPEISVEFSMGPNTRHVRLRGCVQYCASVADNGQVRYFLGVQFQQPERQDESALRSFIQQAANAGFLEAI